MKRLLSLLALLLLSAGPAWALDPWAGCDFVTAGTGVTIVCPDVLTGGLTINAAGGSGTGTPGGVINNIQINDGASGFGPYLGTSCTNQFIRSLDANGAATCATVTGTSLSIAGASCTNQFMTALDSAGAGTCTTDTLASAQHANQGTTSTVLHGNAAGNPSWAAVTSADLSLTATTCTNQFVSAIGTTGLGTCTTDVLASAQHANQGTTATLLHGNAAGNPSWGAVNLTSEVTSVLLFANGGTGLSSAADDTVLVSNGSAWQARNMPSCDDQDGQHLNYSTGSNAFSCGNSMTTSVRRRVCAIIVGADNGSALANADLGPQGRQCMIPADSTVIEVNVAADGGTPSVIPRRNRGGSTANLVSGALSTAAAGGIACSNTGGTTGIDATTTCTNTLQNTSLSAGDYIELISGTAGGTAKRMSIFVIYTTNF